MKKKILILGSTGSIGRATLDVIYEQNDSFEILGLACKDNIQLLNEQIQKFKPKYVCVDDKQFKTQGSIFKETPACRDEGYQGFNRNGCRYCYECYAWQYWPRTYH